MRLGKLILKIPLITQNLTNTGSFKTGHTIQISLISFSFLITVFMTIWFRRENARRAKLLTLGNFTTEMLKAEEDEKGDKSVTFVYTV